VKSKTAFKCLSYSTQSALKSEQSEQENEVADQVNDLTLQEIQIKEQIFKLKIQQLRLIKNKRAKGVLKSLKENKE
jgi:hypothetical protein